MRTVQGVLGVDIFMSCRHWDRFSSFLRLCAVLDPVKNEVTQASEDVKESCVLDKLKLVSPILLLEYFLCAFLIMFIEYCWEVQIVVLKIRFKQEGISVECQAPAADSPDYILNKFENV